MRLPCLPCPSLLLIFLSVSACEATTESLEETRVYVGQLEEADVAIGMMVQDGEIVFYSGGGPLTLATHTRWFEGHAFGVGFEVERDQWTITGTRSDHEASGTMTDPEGSTWVWQMRETKRDDIAGLYRAVDSDVVGGCRTGLVVLTPELAQGAWCDGQGLFAEVTPMSMPIERSHEGVAVQVLAAGEVHQFVAVPIY